MNMQTFKTQHQLQFNIKIIIKYTYNIKVIYGCKN